MTKDENIVYTKLKCLAIEIETSLKPLSNENINRVLLQLHAQIGDQLDRLAENNDQ
jgi:hypothetical protein